LKAFNSVTIVKHPRDLVWKTVRDRLPELIPLMDDIQKITQLKREETPEGTVYFDNLWQANPKLPAGIAANVSADKLAWIDRAEWHTVSYQCHWQIEPRFLPEQIQCWGITHYEPALGGRGTRITFEGQLGIGTQNKSGRPAFLDGSLLSAFETFAASLIPKNLRKLTEAVSEFLDANPGS
jgi:hypothetical protein